MDPNAASGVVMAIGVALLVLVLYMLPTLIAQRRGHRSLVAILLVNLFLGFTVLGWFAALIWAFADAPRASVVQVGMPTGFACASCGAVGGGQFCQNCGAALGARRS